MRYKVRMAEIAVASVQLAPVLGDYAGNQARVLSAVARAAAAGASVVVVPELATSGYAFSSVEEARAVARPGRRRTRAVGVGGGRFGLRRGGRVRGARRCGRLQLRGDRVRGRGAGRLPQGAPVGPRVA